MGPRWHGAEAGQYRGPLGRGQCQYGYRLGELQYGNMAGSAGDSIAASIVPAAKMLLHVKRTVEATGGKQLGKVVLACRNRFNGYLVKQFPGQQLIVWGEGGMVYCNRMYQPTGSPSSFPATWCSSPRER